MSASICALLSSDQLLLESGSYPTGPGTLCIDCTSSWVRSAPTPVPIFAQHRIVLQPVQEVFVGPGEFSIPCSAGIIGLVECLFSKDKQKNELLTPVKWPDTLHEWNWMHICERKLWQDNRIAFWLCSDRLSLWSGMNRKVLHQMLRYNSQQNPHEMWEKLRHMLEQELAEREAKVAQRQLSYQGKAASKEEALQAADSCICKAVSMQCEPAC